MGVLGWKEKLTFTDIQQLKCNPSREEIAEKGGGGREGNQLLPSLRRRKKSEEVCEINRIKAQNREYLQMKFSQA